MKPPAPPVHHEPVRIAPDTWVIQQLEGEGIAPVNVFHNSMVITGEQPAIVDTGSPNNRDRWLEDVFGLVDPADVRWVVLSHDDVDHWGNLDVVLEECPQATVVTSFFLTERLNVAVEVPRTRMRWVEHGDRIDLGDRELVALTPPTFDSPTTRGFFDTTSGVYWASDSFAAPVTSFVPDAADLPYDEWADGFSLFQRMLSPWLTLLDADRWAEHLAPVEALPTTTITGAHGPIVSGHRIAEAFALLREVPGHGPAPLPRQAELDAMLAHAAG